MSTISRLLVVVGAGATLAGCGGSGTDNSQRIVNDIKLNGSNKLIVGAGMSSDIAAVATATVSDATCAQSGSIQAYTCVVHFTVGSAILPTTGYTAIVSGMCDDAGVCLWHVTNVAPA